MKINLLPLARQRKPYRYLNLVVLVVIVLGVSAPLAYYSYQLSRYVTNLRAEVAALEAHVAKLLPIEALLQERQSLEQELARIREIAVPAHAKLLPFLDEVARLMPDQIFIEELTLAEQHLTLRGMAPSYALAAELLRLLAGSELFAHPVLSGLRQGTAGHSFEISVELRVTP